MDSSRSDFDLTNKGSKSFYFAMGALLLVR